MAGDEPVSPLGPRDQNWPDVPISRNTSVASYAGLSPNRYGNSSGPQQHGPTQYEQWQRLERAAYENEYYQGRPSYQSQPYPRQPTRTQPTPTQPAPEQSLTPAQQRARELERAHQAAMRGRTGVGTPEQEQARARALRAASGGGGQPHNGAAAGAQNHSPRMPSAPTAARPQYSDALRQAQLLQQQRRLQEARGNSQGQKKLR
ncbi:hypothetical protein [Streptomyces daliensis]|uniref:Uncharacterized protein n=1 Tax=Streptomyces daliensis TaxID=299421 RepID=A0A8T4ITD8_9ACTN|nr:hypothetical protein [Streptomyces daliensis]